MRKTFGTTQARAGVAAAVACVLLQGCAGGGDDGLSIDERLDLATAMADRLLLLSETDPLDMPDSGGATYRGYALLGIGEDGALSPVDNIFGDMTVTATFTPIGGTIEGSIVRLESQFNGPAGGRLDITNGAIVDALFVADVDGTVISGIDSFAVDAVMEGGFLGPNAEGLGAFIDGTVTGGGLVNGITEGEAIAER